MQIGKFLVLYLTPNDLLCTWTTFHRNEMKGSSALACSFTIPLTVDPSKLWILGDFIRNTATGIVFHKILSTKNFFLLENKWISSICLGSYDEWSSNGIGIKDGFLLSICQLGTLMYANLYKYVPLLVLVSDRQNIVSNHLKMFWPCRAMTFSNLPLDGPDIQQRSGWCQNQEDDLSAVSSSPLISFLHAFPNCSCEQLRSSP